MYLADKFIPGDENFETQFFPNCHKTITALKAAKQLNLKVILLHINKPKETYKKYRKDKI